MKTRVAAVLLVGLGVLVVAGGIPAREGMAQGEASGGVAHAFKVMERAWPLLGTGGAPPERREITVRTAFGGPGARDAFEFVTRAVTGERYVVDGSLARPEHGRARERFVFRLSCRDREVTLFLREGYVTDEFIDLARTDNRSAEEDARLSVLKREHRILRAVDHQRGDSDRGQ